MIVITSAEVTNLTPVGMPGVYTVKIVASAVEPAGYTVNTVRADLKKNVGGTITTIQSGLSMTKVSGQWQVNSSTFSALAGHIIFAEVTAVCSFTEKETATAVEVPAPPPHAAKPQARGQ